MLLNLLCESNGNVQTFYSTAKISLEIMLAKEVNLPPGKDQEISEEDLCQPPLILVRIILRQHASPSNVPTWAAVCFLKTQSIHR
jgi:hypothetical protein